MKEVIPKLPVEERVFWAGARFAPKEALEALARDRSKKVRKRLARNPATPPHALERLAKDKECWRDLAENPSSPPALLEKLWNVDPNRLGRLIARNPSTPPSS